MHLSVLWSHTWRSMCGLFIIPLSFIFKVLLIFFVLLLAVDALAFSCGMTECERCADWVWEHGYAFWRQHTVAFRQASLFVFIALRTHEPLLTGSNVSPPQPIHPSVYPFHIIIHLFIHQSIHCPFIHQPFHL